MPDVNTWSPRAAAFVIQALELDMAPAELAAGMATLRHDADGAVLAFELSSTVGSTPFLVYVYAVPAGSDRFEADVATMERAASLDTPGPRIVASATTDQDAFILATTPAVQRVLSGEDQSERSAAPDRRTVRRRRREAPGQLIAAIRTANELAGEWLTALKDAADGTDDGELTFTDEEAALALYLLDAASAADLLQAMNLALAAARGGGAPPITQGGSR